VHVVNSIRQTKIHVAEPLLPESSSFEIETAIEKLKRYKLPHIDQVQVELIQAGGKTLDSQIHKIINSV
jgi:hypothetical protein